MSYDPALDNIYSCLEFFSLRDNVWKEMDCPYCPYRSNFDEMPKAGCLYNGAIHWLAFHRDFPWRDNFIVAFDLNERKLFEMPPPDDFEHDAGDCGLWVFGEFFSLWSTDYPNDSFEIWVMKEYKVNSSWTKILVLNIDDDPTLYFYPLCRTKSGDIIGINVGVELVKYDDNGQLLERSPHWESLWGVRSQVAMYTESLLSLPGDNEQA
ncbi:F-box protein interaction domain protein [Medicago truncatula]|uniref:F-box protein interaction domain protein n=2 Tax=Medicago truncatula TaxID=3880 RepID=A0A072U014_MEDTR|nr:F-box protein interaction domain protein [Medicago truncatula]